MNIFPEIKTEVGRWDALVFGHLFWNRYFGETGEKPPRGIPSTCSSVLIRGKQTNGKAAGSDFCLIVDPATRHSPDEYYFDLNRRTGLGPQAVTHCFVTHHHFDHWHGLKYFPQAKWLTGTGNRALIIEASEQARSSGRGSGDGLSPEIDAERLLEVSGEFLPGVWAVPLPGHTALLHGAAFRYEGRRILVAGDAVITGYHFKDRTTEFQSDESMRSIAAAPIGNIAASFDMVVPGHDNLIVV
jgi:glyoxylase-like metal-dependent hydrolase (beta-lactamase superfamily II)